MSSFHLEHVSSVQNPCLIPLYSCFFWIPLLDDYNPQYMKGSRIPYNYEPRKGLNTAHLEHVYFDGEFW